MKIRIGFVSNSSSMSFIVAVKKRGKCPHCGQKPDTLLDLVERGGYETFLHAKGQDDVLAYMKREMEEYFEDNDGEDNTEEVIQKVKELSKNTDFDVACINISQNDDYLQGFMDEEEKKGNVVTIYA
ncbi:MAG: transposase family protein [Proteobacteria bacterium]|jgi:hypothetical protein|nr:transposase family protein [Pseudomonadota bacterium]